MAPVPEQGPVQQLAAAGLHPPLHGVAEEGVALRDIAEVIGRHLDVPVTSVAPEAAEEHFTWLSPFMSLDVPVSNTLTRELLDWQPTRLSLLEDLAKDHYFHTPGHHLTSPQDATCAGQAVPARRGRGETGI
ncbi:hypothetical protein ACIOHS_43540 [Streptomyces sp. NPDC088253]|uniref:hypothetical protein n=1 Tax=Streptomyces sp. NPDC088253 TaxID=3365846 RepID=UPI0037F13A39